MKTKQTTLDKDFGFKASVSNDIVGKEEEDDKLERALNRPIKYFDCVCGCHDPGCSCEEICDCKCCKENRCKRCGWDEEFCYNCDEEVNKLYSHPFDKNDKHKYCEECMDDITTSYCLDRIIIDKDE